MTDIQTDRQTDRLLARRGDQLTIRPLYDDDDYYYYYYYKSLNYCGFEFTVGSVAYARPHATASESVLAAIVQSLNSAVAAAAALSAQRRPYTTGSIRVVASTSSTAVF